MIYLRPPNNGLPLETFANFEFADTHILNDPFSFRLTAIFGHFLNLKSKTFEQDLNTDGGFVVFKLFASFLKAFALSLSLSEL